MTSRSERVQCLVVKTILLDSITRLEQIRVRDNTCIDTLRDCRLFGEHTDSR